MKKSEMIELFRSFIDTKPLVRLFMKYDNWYICGFPFYASDKLFLTANEDDFIIDGFSIRRFRDLKKTEIKNDKCVEILKAEKVLEGMNAPEIDLTDWHSAFLSLQKLGKNVIVEHESTDENEWEFYIGRIEKVLKNKIAFRHFDADGVWQEEPYEILFSEITSVTFDSRYVTYFSKHIENDPYI